VPKISVQKTLKLLEQNIKCGQSKIVGSEAPSAMTPTISPPPQPKNSQNVNYALLSTSSTLGRVRGFSIELLFMLHEGGGRCCDLSERSGKTQPYVHRYLKNLRKYNLVCRNEAFWFLTDFGAEFVKYLSIVYNNIIDYRKKKERKKEERRKKIESSAQKRVFQARFDIWLQNCNLLEKEKEIVEILTDHYKRTGSKYLLFATFYDVAARFQVSPDNLNQIFMNLKQDHVAYCWRDKTHDAWKVALYKAFVEALEKNEGG